MLGLQTGHINMLSEGNLLICWGLTANIERVNVSLEQGSTSETKDKEEAKQEKQTESQHFSMPT